MNWLLTYFASANLRLSTLLINDEFQIENKWWSLLVQLIIIDFSTISLRLNQVILNLSYVQQIQSATVGIILSPGWLSMRTSIHYITHNLFPPQLYPAEVNPLLIAF